MVRLRAPRATTLALGIATALLISAVPSLADERIVVGGAGIHIPVMQAVADVYNARNPSRPVEVLTKTLGSTGGIRAADAGAVTIGLVSRRPHADEAPKLVYRAYARTPFIVGVHPDVPIAGVTDAQLCAIFSGRITSWKDLGGPAARIVVLTRNEDGSKETIRDQVACFRDLKETADAVVMTKPSAMNDALIQRPGTIGLADLAALIEADGRFKPLAFNGVPPSLESLRSGRYPLYKTLGMVTAGEPQGAVRRFMEFVVGPEGERIMSRHGLVSVR